MKMYKKWLCSSFVLLALCGSVFGDLTPAQKLAVQVEEAFADVVEQTKSAVVVITNKQSTPASSQMNRIPEDFFEFFNLPRNTEKPGTVRPAGKGSGFFISSKGYIVTNYHVISEHDFLCVKTADGTVYDNQKDPNAVKVIGCDEETDLAVLQVGNGKKNDFKYLEFADSSKLRVGQWAIAIGAPFSLDYSVTTGCVSQKGRTDLGVSAFDSYIQTDASINPGNSGGPLLNIRGQVIGVNQFIVTGGNGSKGSVGVGFAIASNLVKQITNDLIANGQVSRAFLGISMQNLNEALKAELEVKHGVLVREVLSGEAAEQAGIKPGDVITYVNDKRIEDSHDLLTEVAKNKPGVKMTIRLQRNGKEMRLTIKPGKRDEYFSQNQQGYRQPKTADKSIEKLGLKLTERKGKVVVQEVRPGGAAAKASEDNDDSIRPGDVILDINRMPIHSLADVKRALTNRKRNSVIVYIERKLPNGAYKFYIAINLEK